MGEAAAEGDGSMGEAAKAHRPEMHTGQSVGWPTAATADPEDGDMHEADMDEPADAEPTAAEYQSFFDSILALP